MGRAAAPPNLAAESDGGVVCELRRVWKEMSIVRQGIARDWPESRAKAARMQEEDRHLAVISEAGKRLKAHISKTPLSEVGEEGF
jgi:hypothetical protein